ncbi:LysR substrate-binding domain-containing protein [Aurantimonas sp. C2-6-R+9]|uniref:LysR substrate-binding domain-containing protein n=1 Tax=unclassified Aurantimonas TaxID=2638230 RepID=UPI002E197988|nr:LysR substrate-binding domain-containing protein [Aurantimonas sp. C2-6-R+9]
MDLRQLRYFIAIVEEGSFSKAALSLRIAQPALSLHVRNMEADLDTELLLRTPQGVKPTETGSILLKQARSIVAQFETARQEIQEHESEPSGEVRLGLPGSISQILSVPLILEMRRLYPKVRLRVTEAMSGFVLEWLRDRRVDLALLYIPLDDRGLKSYGVLSEELCLIGPVSDETFSHLLPESRISLSEICRLPLILPSIGHGLRSLIDEVAASNGLTLEPVMDIDSYASIKELVAHQLGYSILPRSAITREVKGGNLRAWATADGNVPVSVETLKWAALPASSR